MFCPRGRPWLLPACAAALLLLFPAHGLAQEPPPGAAAGSTQEPPPANAAGPVQEPPPGDAAELAELEKALGADQKQQQEVATDRPQDAGGVTGAIAGFIQTLNPDISFIADVALAYFSADDPLMAGGHDPTKTGFTLQQLELAIGAAVDPYFRFDANIVFSQYGVEIEEVYATTLSLPFNLQLRAGQFLTRFGRINTSHPHSRDFVDQSLVIGKFFGGEGNRGLGVEFSWLAPGLPWYVELVGSATDAAGASTARSFYGGDDLGVDGLGDFQYTAALKQFFPLSDNWSLFWGLSFASGPNPTGRDNHSEVYGTDLYLKYRPITRGSYTVVSLQAEYLLRRRQVPGEVLMDHGLYGYLFYRFARRWAAAARYEYVTGLSGDYLDPAWIGDRHRASGNVTFWPTEFSRLRLQYGYDLPAWRDGYHMVMLAMEFAVGAHGAHKF